MNQRRLYYFLRTPTKEINSGNFIFVKGRSSRLEVFCKKDVLKNFAKCTKRTVSESLLFRITTLSKKDTPAQMFSCEFLDFFTK